MEMQMTEKSTDASIRAYSHWNQIPWEAVEQSVRRLQTRIAKAVMEKNHRKVNALQWILTHSYHAKLLAVRRVTTNRGKNTPGVDGVVWKSARRKMTAANSLRRKGYAPQPLRRVYIPKKNGKKRPLSIPTMYDRAMQALYKMALDPVAETTADPNSYGFRPHRRCADAIGQCYIALAKKISPTWILEGDIKACFDEISHEWILNNIPLDKKILSKWLKAGHIEEKTVYPTRKGTPQGGIISPTIANMVLDGLEGAAIASVPTRLYGRIRPKVNVIRYADDFIVTGDSKQLLEDKVKPAIESFLKTRGLQLSEEKTHLTHIESGFSFLSQNVRKYKGKLLITPTKDSIRSVLENINNIIRKYRGVAAEVLIGALNPVLRGWVNYHRHVVAKDTFSVVSNHLYRQLWKWMRRRHGKKNKHWLARKYWLVGKRPWVFSTRAIRHGAEHVYELFHPHRVAIVRHTKIRANANPYDPAWEPYFQDRKRVLARQKLCVI
jgi:RNA-directed DNA polymerase